MADYLTAIEGYLMANNIQKERNGHNPSSASMVTLDGKVEGECLRKLYYSYSGVAWTNPSEAKSLLRMSFGNILHAGLVGHLKASGHQVEEEVAIEVKLDGLQRPLRARADAIIDKTSGLEFKFSFGKGGKDLKKNGPRQSWVMQAQLCMKAFGLQEWTLIAIDFPSLYRAQFDLKRDDQMIDAMIGRMKLLEVALESKTIPVRDFNKDYDWQCGYCPFKDYCWGGGEQLKLS